VGFIFQSFNLLATLSAVENVEAPMMLADINKRQRHRRALSLLESVSLSHRALHKPSELSGGEKQRVAIARALANGPSLLLADEPTGNLDSKTGVAILDMLCQLLRREKVTMLLVTHDPQVAARADRIIHLWDGRIERIENHVKAGESSAEGGAQ
jgi:putative ABC transport system ATP-binding protein